ncbi:fucolectin-related protein [Elysia marginata]|uniref:Fucolectin-related protein n=1 Tax=Elysia marginata TaxID=1093978 RepID=A0AAV4FX34_9GAST|nr:fucolectin-related protein [Elysia marginata]
MMMMMMMMKFLMMMRMMVRIMELACSYIYLFWLNTEACYSGWFGDNCQYQCHCAESTPCNQDGSCNAGCSENWFGPACQYDSVSYQANDVGWLLDKDDRTCNDGSTSTIHVTLDTAIPITWVRVVFNDADSIDKIRLFYTPQNSRSAEYCPDKRKAQVDDKTVDISCQTSVVAEELALDGDGVRHLCSLYISGGRNVALKQTAEQSSTYELGTDKWNAKNAVDGRTGVSYRSMISRTCTHTDSEAGPGWWKLKFSSAVDISRFLIYNRDENCCRIRLKNFKLTAEPENRSDIPFTYTDSESSAKVVYSVVPSPKISFKVTEIRVDVSSSETHIILTLCEVFVFGEIHCPPGQFGFKCERQCNCMNGDSCFVHSGGCPSGCASGYVGEDCSGLFLNYCGKHNYYPYRYCCYLFYFY